MKQPVPRSSPVSLLVPLLLACLSFACRSAAPPGVLQGTALPLDDARASRVIETYLETSASRNALRGSARVALSGPDFKLNRPQHIVVERPARLRFEVIGLFEQLAAVLVSDGESYGFYDAATGEMEHGAITPTLLWELAQVDVEVGEAVGILLGAPRPSPSSLRAAVWVEADERVAVAFANGADRIRADCPTDPERGWHDPACFGEAADLDRGGDAFVFDRAGRLVELRSFEAKGVLRYRARFEDYAGLGEGTDRVEFPNRVTIESPAVRSEARFVWKRVMLAAELSDRLFRLPERGAGRSGRW